MREKNGHMSSAPPPETPGRGETTATPAQTPASASRRRFLGGAGLAAAGVAVGAAGGFAVGRSRDAAAETTSGSGAAEPSKAAAVVPFYGEHQAGVTTTQQERLMFAALDVTTTDKQELTRMLGRWAAMASRFTQGLPVSDAAPAAEQAPLDTGEAMDLGPYSLTVTVGFGASLFDDRFGLADRLPAALKPLGTIPGDAVMREDISGGDLCIQACADDPQVVFHAVRNLVRAARGTAVLRWSQLGFGRASATGAGQTTPRNLLGFKDGTNNIHADDSTAVDDHVWVAREADQDWMRGGSYLVARKIRMEIEHWDVDPLSDQEKIFGRTKTSGAPLTGGGEFTPIDFGAKNSAGDPVIDVDAHVRLASPEENKGIRILRRGYNYTDGQDPVTGKLSAGLFFIAYQKDPHTQFKVLQSRLGQFDLLNEYIAHIGGGVWAVPPGLSAAGDWFGKALLAD
jgi:deferrochelatase/peroxidase EfeB